MPKSKTGDSPQEKFIREAYANLKSPKMILAEMQALGLTSIETTQGIKVVATRLRLTRTFYPKDAHAWSRGSYIPPDKWDEYKYLMKYMTSPEAGIACGGVSWDDMRKALKEYKDGTPVEQHPTTQAEAITAAYNWYVAHKH